MKIKALDSDTEELIKNTAKRVFFKEGKLHATTLDIADAAGINRASIHYYFRSRKHLFDKVFEEAVREMQGKLRGVMSQDLPLRQTMETVMDFFLKRSMEHPYLELFVIAELNTDPDMYLRMMPVEEMGKRRLKLKAEIDAEVAAGRMKPIKPEHFIVNMMSLCSFPLLAKSIVKNATNMNEDEYQQFINERKQVILKLIFLDE
jgi:AcrR family transcriptional regulator